MTWNNPQPTGAGLSLAPFSEKDFVTEMVEKRETKFISHKRPVGRPRKYRTNAARQRAYRRRRRQAKQLVYWRSTTDLWSTPPDVFAALDAEFHFTTDVCALPENATCAHYYTPEQDGLTQVWTGACYANPPYGLVLRQWVRKAWESAQAGATVVCLLPVRTDTVWWQHYVLPYAEVRFLPKRLKFGGTPYNATFPSAVVIFRPTPEGPGGPP